MHDFKFYKPNGEEVKDTKSLSLIYQKFFLNYISSEIIKIPEDQKADHKKLEIYKAYFKENFFEESIKKDLSALYSHNHQADAGHIVLKPKLTILKKCLTLFIERFIRSELPEVNEIDTPNLYDIDSKYIQYYLKKFPSRSYKVINEKKEFALRFAACPNHFFYAKNNYLSSKNLPLYIFEMADCYRLEQTGELKSLKRVRKFLMQDMHVFTEKDKSFKEFMILVQNIKKVLTGLNLFEDCVPTVRCSKFYFDENKDKLLLIGALYNKIVFFEIWEEQAYYFQVKFEMNSMVDLHESQLSTVQIDNTLPELYDVRYNSNESTHRVEALHVSLIGSLERLMEVMLRKGLPSKFEYPRLMIITEGAPEDVLNNLINNLANICPIQIDSRQKNFYKRVNNAKNSKEFCQILYLNKSELKNFEINSEINSFSLETEVIEKIKFQNLFEINSFYKHLGKFLKDYNKQLP